ncbi:MAG: HesA/MoeB/ThiF family protein [Steroidobacteraceae bacterium]
MALSTDDLARYQRHLSLPEIGAEGQERLGNALVGIVGMGGLGSPAALYLAAAGIGRLRLIDHDAVDLSNLQRQVLYATADIGAAKVECARARLQALNPAIEVTACNEAVGALNAGRLLGDCDVVVDGTDRLAARYLVNDACVLLGRTLVSAAIHRFEGQMLTVVPGKGPCYRCLFAESADGLVPNCADAGVLGVLPGVMGCLQATEVIKLITAIGEPLVGRLLVFDALAMSFRRFAVERRVDCAVCGDSPSIRTLRSHAAATVSRMSASELSRSAERIRRGDLAVVDVREEHEFVAGHLPGAINIPLAQLPTRLHELPVCEALVMLCRSGGRSEEACQAALRAGVNGVFNLDGGLLAWARDIDPSLRVVDP